MSERRILTAYGRRRVRLAIAALVAAVAGAVGCLFGDLAADVGLTVGLVLGVLAVASIDLASSRMLQVRLGRRPAILLLSGLRWRYLMLDESLRVTTAEERLALSGQPMDQRLEILQTEFRHLELARVAAWLNELAQRGGAYTPFESTPAGFEALRTPLFATLRVANRAPQRGLRAVAISSTMAALFLVKLLGNL